MATSKLIPMHKNIGKTIAKCLADRTDYVKNPNKTDNGKFVSSYECDPRTVQGEFRLSKRAYLDITGRTQEHDVIAYQIRQSFKPGEITPELANKLGYELAMSFTKGKHAFIVATHIDKAHIHSHIIFNSTSLDCKRKFRNFFGSTYAVGRLSDRICLENGLSIIENPKKSKGHYGKWLGDKKKLTHSDKIRMAIDDALLKKPQTFEQFLHLMEVAGYEVKRGKHIGFKSAEQGKFIRFRSLGKGYLQDEIIAIIEGKAPIKEKKNKRYDYRKSVNLLVDIQAKIDEGKGVGYEQWAKIYNLKQMAQTINYLRENNLIVYEVLEERVNEITTNFDSLNTEIKAAEKRMAEIQVLRTHIINYMKTKDTYTAYRKAGYSKKFYMEHESELIIHKAAKSAFDELGTKKLPTIKVLQAEYAELLSAKKKAYATYKSTKKDMQEILRAKENVDRILDLCKCQYKNVVFLQNMLVGKPTFLFCIFIGCDYSILLASNH